MLSRVLAAFCPPVAASVRRARRPGSAKTQVTCSGELAPVALVSALAQAGSELKRRRKKGDTFAQQRPNILGRERKAALASGGSRRIPQCHCFPPSPPKSTFCRFRPGLLFGLQTNGLSPNKNRPQSSGAPTKIRPPDSSFSFTFYFHLSFSLHLFLFHTLSWKNRAT